MPNHLHPYWRMQYIRSRKDPQAGSPFAALLAAGDDRTSLIVHRGRTCFVILNNFPYNPGHLMVLPNREVGELAQLLIFLLIFTPMALIFRLIGRDALQRKIDHQASTYWQPKPQPRNSRSYYRQF